MFEIHVLEDYEQVSQKAFEVFKEVLNEPHPVLGLATGSSPVGLYARLVAAYDKGELSMKHVKTFNLDEYIGLDRNHPQSYYTFMYDNLFKHVDVPSESIHIPQGKGALEKLTKEYEALLVQNPQDIQVLGLGSNGHIGFNEPGSEWDSVVHVVNLKPETRVDNARFFESIDEVPDFAVTMGIADIMRAKKILLIATGKKKAEAINEMINGELRNEVPCTILQKHPHVVVIVDKAAGSKLKHD